MSELDEASEGGRDGQIGVTEPERLAAVVRLRDRYANDEISLDEFSRAVDGALAARTAQELSGASPSRALVAPASRVPWLGAEALQQHLWPGEEILWVGRPEANLPRGSVIKIVPFVAFVLLWEAVAVSSGAPAWFPLWGILIVGVGIYRVIGRFWLQARRTVYGVTTHRLLRIVRRSSGDQTDTKLLRTVPSISVTQGKHDRGTVTFGDGPSVQPIFRGTSFFNSQSVTEPITFANITDPVSVGRLIGSLQAYE